MQYARTFSGVKERRKEIEDRRKRFTDLLEMEQEYLELLMAEDVAKVRMVHAHKIPEQRQYLNEITKYRAKIDKLRKDIPKKQKECLGFDYKTQISPENPKGTPIKAPD